MQKSPDVVPSSDFLDGAFARAQEALHAQQASVTAAARDDDTLDELVGERLLLGHELWLEVREPIEWVLALARRLAADDPEDVAAIDRLTAAFHARLACSGHGVRVADMLTAFGILVAALDPEIVLASARKAVADGVTTILACESAAVAARLARLVDEAPHAVIRRICLTGRSRARHSSAAR